MTAIGVYARISDDAGGEALGVQRQEQDCRQVANLRGWDVAEAYVDNDISAFRRGVVRPAFEHLLSDLADGNLDGVVVYDLDRLARQPRDLERLIDLYDTRRRVFATVQGDIDLGSADGLTMARVMVAFANKSSRDTSRRVARKALETAQRGVPVGMRPFGWREDKQALEPAEAAQIRAGAKQLMAGVPLGSLTDQWNAAGGLTSRGNPWQRQTLRQMYLSPRLAGLRPYHGDVLIDDAGEPVRGQWEPILTVEQWQRLVAKLTAARTGERPGGRRYLLSGLMRCGACSGVMVGNKATGKGHFFACKPANQGGCGQVNVIGPRVEAMVEEVILDLLGGITTAPSAVEFPGAVELTDKAERVAQLMAAYAAGQLGAEVVFPAVESLQERIAVLRTEQKVHRPVMSTTTRAEWPALEVGQKREIISTYVSAVVVKPAAHRGGRFDPSRIELVWR